MNRSYGESKVVTIFQQPIWRQSNANYYGRQEHEASSNGFHQQQNSPWHEKTTKLEITLQLMQLSLQNQKNKKSSIKNFGDTNGSTCKTDNRP